MFAFTRHQKQARIYVSLLHGLVYRAIRCPSPDQIISASVFLGSSNYHNTNQGHYGRRRLSTDALLEKSARFQDLPLKSLTNKDLHQAVELVQKWANHKDPTPENLDYCFQILDRLVDAVELEGNRFLLKSLNNMLLPVIVHWEQAWQIQPNGWTAKQVLNRLEEWKKRTKGKLKPAIPVYNVILNCYRNGQSQEDPEKAAAFVQTILENLLRDPKGTRPNLQTYEIVAEAWLDVLQLERAYDVLTNVLQLQSEETIQVDVNILEKALQICAQQGSGAGADAFLRLMVDFYDNQLLVELPKISHYTQVIYAWANARDSEQSEKRMTDILSFLQEQSETNPSLTPTTETYNAVLQTYSQLNQLGTAETLLLDLTNRYHTDPKNAVQPDTKWFHTILQGYSQSRLPDAGEKAELLLKQLNEFPSKIDSLQVDAVCYTAVMQSYVASSHPNAPDHVERLYEAMLKQSCTPIRSTFITRMQAWAQDGEVDQAAKVLSDLCDQYQADPDTSPEPDVECYNTLIRAYAESGDISSGKEARRLLDQMWKLDRAGKWSKVRPNAASYTACIQAWSKSGHAFAGREAEDLIQEQKEKAEALGDVYLHPTVETYNAVVGAWAECDNYWQAKDFFVTIPKEIRSVDSYNLLLMALCRSEFQNYSDEARTFNKGEQADAIITAMTVRGMKPNQSTHQLAYQCWELAGQNTEKSARRMAVLEHKLKDYDGKEFEAYAL